MIFCYSDYTSSTQHPRKWSFGMARDEQWTPQRISFVYRNCVKRIHFFKDSIKIIIQWFVSFSDLFQTFIFFCFLLFPKKSQISNWISRMRNKLKKKKEMKKKKPFEIFVKQLNWKIQCSNPMFHSREIAQKISPWIQVFYYL